MDILRGLFWLGVVAIFVPSGPNLGLDPSGAHGVLSRNPAQVVVEKWRDSLVTAADPVERFHERYRAIVLARLAALRTELDDARAQRMTLAAVSSRDTQIAGMARSRIAASSRRAPLAP